MRRLIALLCAAFSCSCASVPAVTCPAGPDGVPRAENQSLKSVVSAYSTANSDTAVQAAVIMPGNIVLNATAGYADRKTKCPPTRDTLMLLGGITELYTAALIMHEAEEGRIALDDSIDRWISAPWAGEVTVRMLLNHTSGIPSYTSSPCFRTAAYIFKNRSWTPGQIEKYFISKPLLFKPGSMYGYSASNYVLLGVILEKTTGKTYGALIEERLKTGGTCFDCPEGSPFANGYDRPPLSFGMKDISSHRITLQTSAFSSGGVASSANETAWFIRHLLAGNILTPKAADGMIQFTDARDKNHPGLAGCGLGVEHFMIGGEDLYGHAGGMPGYSGIALHSLKKGYTICVLGNLSNLDMEGLVNTIIQKVVMNEASAR